MTRYTSVLRAKRNRGIMAFIILILLGHSSIAWGEKPNARIEYGFITQSSSDPWQHLSLDISQKTKWLGTASGRLNVARRFGSVAAQMELEAYPKISSSLYLYLGVGYSPFSLFPKLRFGGEVFANVPGGNEFSLGWRSLQFASTSVTVLTGSYGKYVGNCWISLRPYVSVREGGSSGSLHATVRQYFRDANEYLGGSIGWGFSPGEGLTSTELDRLDSIKISIGGKKPLSPGAIVSWSLGYENEKLSGERMRTQMGGTVGYEFVL